MKVIVVGAGAVGLAVAGSLARRGRGQVVVLEREPAPGYGASGRNPGAVRSGFASPLNTALTLAALPLLEELQGRSGISLGFRRQGYLWLASTEAQVPGLQRVVAELRERGGVARWLDAGAAVLLVPALAPGRLLGGALFPEDGTLDPHALTLALAGSGRAAGAEIRCGTPALSIAPHREGWAVELGGSRDWADAVVVAGGAWSPGLLAPLGVPLPLTPFRRHSFFSGPARWLEPRMPFVVDAETGAYFRPLLGSVLFGRGREYDLDLPSLSLDVDPGAMARALGAAATVVPAMAGLTVRFGVAGPYQMTPDRHALLGPVPGLPGLYVACGFSGHGLMHAPITGELIADWVTAGQPLGLPEARALTLDRFSRGEELREDLQI